MKESLTNSLKNLLIQWQNDQLTTGEVHRRAEELAEEINNEKEYSRTEPDSIPAEVIQQLEILNHQLLIKKDIPAMLEFLNTQPGNEAKGWLVWETYWKSINFNERKRLLANDPDYII